MRKPHHRPVSRRAVLLCFFVLDLSATAAPLALPRPYPVTEAREPCADFEPLRRPFFGDTHVHTVNSFDANTQDTRKTPRDAYAFAKGAPLGLQPYDENGNALRTVKLARPLDFVAVTDHAEMLGETNICTAPGSDGYDSIPCIVHRNFSGVTYSLIGLRGTVGKSRWESVCGEGYTDCTARTGQVWQTIRDAAEEAYDRSAACKFTSFVAYEWTATVGAGKNLHRNVIFRNASVPELPPSWIDTESALDLWNQLETGCVEGIPGCDVLTIPHNSNLSSGLMFETPALSDADDAGTPIDAALAKRRARWEPLIEIMQHKGDSECELGIDTTDELCNFENLPYDSFGAKFSFFIERKQAEANNFVRWALKRGLAERATLGVNPFHYGIIAATDTHIAAPGLTREKDHPGHGGAGIGAGAGVPEGFPDDLEFNPGGLGVLWAEENTRDSLFAAMRRREAYGTSGTRPVVRFFGGWDLPEDMCASAAFVRQGYAKGVPMGGDLPPQREGAPRFAVWALQDPGNAAAPGTPLQRVQIVKGWHADGELHERVIDVAGGPNAASVDLSTCEPRGEGHASLCEVWEDPDFDATQDAFYYARVVENPTCRWSQYICNAAGVVCSEPDTVPDALRGCCADSHQPTLQERAWTSPIWYAPTDEQ
ncbi:MAG: DUF3604 domain-containing protein [Deltaproteobacteria bacterium]|nr:DUF3604 domain-containing protein [Deltaproteobacteria bacterium]